jgi:hypothetical protein
MRISPPGGVGQVGQELAQRALAAARGADQGDHLAGRQPGAHPVQHRLVAVGEGEVVDHHLERSVGQRHGVHGSGPQLGGEDLGDAVVGHHGARELLQEEADDPEREGQDGEQGHRLHELARGEVAVGDPPRAEPQQHDGAEVGERVEGGLEAGPQLADAEPGLAQALGRGPHPLDLPLLEAERLHDQHAVEALVGHGRDVADAGLGVGGGALDPARVRVVGQGQAREQGHGHEKEHPVDEGQLGHRHEDDHDHAEGERQRLHHHRRALAVGVGVGQQLAGRTVVEPAQGHPEVPVGDRLEPVDLHPALGHLAEVAAQDHADHAQHRRADDGEDADGDGVAPHAPLLEGGGEDVVGDLAEDDRAPDGHHREDHRADEGHREGPRLEPHRPPEQAQAAAHELLVGLLPLPHQGEPNGARARSERGAAGRGRAAWSNGSASRPSRRPRR